MNCQFLVSFRKKIKITIVAMFYFCKCQIKPRIEYCCYTQDGAYQYLLPSLARFQKRLSGFVPDEIFPALSSYPRDETLQDFRHLRSSHLGHAIFTW